LKWVGIVSGILKNAVTVNIHNSNIMQFSTNLCYFIKW